MSVEKNENAENLKIVTKRKTRMYHQNYSISYTN